MSYYLIHITYPILFLAVLARQLFLPVPAILFLLSGGALVGAGKLSYAGILLVAVLGCVLADLVWFEQGASLEREWCDCYAPWQRIRAIAFVEEE